MTDSTPRQSNSELAAKINRLFDTLHKPSEPPLSNMAAAEAITAKTGVSISSTYLWQLRSGLKDNPTLAHLKAIAAFFGVSAAYFLDPEADEKISDQLDLVQALRDAGVRDVAARMSGLKPNSIKGIRVIVDQVRQLEKLPPIEHTDTDDNDRQTGTKDG